MQTETVLVTGASSGIGWELAKCFAADSSRIVLVARREKELQELASLLQDEYGVDTVVLSKDLTRPEAPPEIRDYLVAAEVFPDIVVNNAGIGSVGKVADLSTQRLLDIIQLNVSALTHLTRLLLPEMLKRRRGGILNVASTAAFQSGPTMAVYYATKAYVLSFSEALTEELRGTGVTATCLAPGPTFTEFGGESGIDKTFLFKLGTMNAARVARAGHRGFRRRRAIVIPGFMNKVGAFLTRLSPRLLTRKVVRRLQKVDSAEQRTP